MVRIVLVVCAGLIICGCAAKPIQLNDKVAIYQHGNSPQGYSDALSQANAHCKKYGKIATMDGQSCPGQCTSQFRCE